MEINLDEPPAERSGPDILPDIPDFVSPVDRSIVHGRASLREHNKRNGVTNAADFTETWKRDAQRRAAFFQGTRTDTDLKEHLNRAYEKLRRR